MSGHILWCGTRIPFQPGESVASALLRAGVLVLGAAPSGQARAVFCGIGQCQGCLIRVDGRLTEACLLPCRDGMAITADQGAHDA